MVVEAPLDSEPSTPMEESMPPPAYVQPWAEDVSDSERDTGAREERMRGRDRIVVDEKKGHGDEEEESKSRTPPPLPQRRDTKLDDPIVAKPVNVSGVDEDDDDYSAWMDEQDEGVVGVDGRPSVEVK